MNDKRINQYLVLPEAGQRKDTKLAVEYDEAQIADYLSQGYVIVGSNDFNKLIGNGDGEYLIADDGSVYPKPAPTDAELLAVAKPAKIAELKAERDEAEVTPIEYNGNLFDFDEKARDRINSAIIALDIAGQSIEWTTAGNTNVLVTADDLRGIVAAVAMRSNELHVKYRQLKEQVEACTTKEQLEKIEW